MIKKFLFFIISLTALCIGTVSYAYEMNMYVNNQFVVRDIENVAGFDMLPVLDIAGELGFNCTYNNNKIVLYNDIKSFTFTVGNPAVYDNAGTEYGLDVVPQVINKKVRVPANFFQKALGLSYTWDPVTNTIFMGSDNVLTWLINTPEYKSANPKHMAKVYSDYFKKQGVIYSYGGDTVGNISCSYKYDELWYYMADVNYDGILDMVISGEDYCSNGIIIYSYKDGRVVKEHSEGMPFSAGSECYTLAVYEGKYGILYHRYNSADDFAFAEMDKYWDMSLIMRGSHYGDGMNYINHYTVSIEKWYEWFTKIKPVAFYNFYSLINLQ